MQLAVWQGELFQLSFFTSSCNILRTTPVPNTTTQADERPWDHHGMLQLPGPGNCSRAGRILGVSPLLFFTLSQHKGNNLSTVLIPSLDYIC